MTNLDPVKAASHAQALLHALGVDLTRDQTRDTPTRWTRALIEMTEGLRTDPGEHLARTFPPESPDPGMIVVPGVRFSSLCEHHMMPFVGTATVAYIPKPGAPIVGLSKLARLVQGYAAQPQVQERLGQQIVDAVTDRLLTDGAACVIRSAHTCMTARGARADGAEMVTSHLAGVFRTDPAARAEFMALAAGRANH